MGSVEPKWKRRTAYADPDEDVSQDNDIVAIERCAITHICLARVDRAVALSGLGNLPMWTVQRTTVGDTGSLVLRRDRDANRYLVSLSPSISVAHVDPNTVLSHFSAWVHVPTRSRISGTTLSPPAHRRCLSRHMEFVRVTCTSMMD